VNIQNQSFFLSAGRLFQFVIPNFRSGEQLLVAHSRTGLKRGQVVGAGHQQQPHQGRGCDQYQHPSGAHENPFLIHLYRSS
jgi:hypothetical protein